MTTIIKITIHLLTFFILFSAAQRIANAENLLNNPGFEKNIDGWNSNSSTIGLNSTSYAGNTSLVVIGRNTNTDGPGQNITEALRNSGKGSYNLQAYIKLNTGSGTGRITVTTYDDTGRNYHSISNPVNAENFSNVEGTINLDWSGSLYYARLHIETGRETTTTMLVDEVSLSPVLKERLTNPTVLYYQSHLSNPKPLKNAILEPRPTAFFISDSSQYKKVNFYCCKGLTGNATGEPHDPAVTDLEAPFILTRDVAKLAPGRRELYFDGFLTTGGIEKQAVYFEVGTEITTNNQNTAPIITGSPAKQVVSSSPYYFQPTAVDNDNDRLTFSISGQPGWTIFDSKTGRLSGIPVKGEAGNYHDIIISVSDGKDTTRLPAFNIQVVPVDASKEKSHLKIYYSYDSDLSKAKLLDGAVLQGQKTYFFIAENTEYSKVVFYCCKGHTAEATGKQQLPAVVDNNSPYSFSVDTSNMAPGVRELYIDYFLANGKVENRKVFFNIVKDSSEPNNSLQISEPSEKNINESSTYNFEPTVNNTKNETSNTIAYYSYLDDLSNPKPLEGAVLEPRKTYFFITDNGQYKATTFYCCKGISGNATGESHLPSVVDTTSPYRFSQDTKGMSTGTRELYFDTFLTDGGIENHSVNFSVAGDSNQAASFTVKWTAPSAREDNSPLSLSEIAGYTVHYGRSKGNYSNHIKVNDHSATSKAINNIAAGKYYVAVTTRDVSGRESSHSKEIVINAK